MFNFYIANLIYFRALFRYDATNRHDNVRDEKDTVLFVFVTQLMNVTASTNLATPTPRVASQFGVISTGDSYPFIINEPNLQINLVFSTYTADGLDRVNVNVTITHTATSTSAAYDVVSAVEMPAWFHLIEGAMSMNGTINNSSAGAIATPEPYYLWGNVSGDTNASIYIPYLGLGSTVRYSFSFLVDTHVPSDYDITTTARVNKYFSAPNSTLTNRR